MFTALVLVCMTNSTEYSLETCYTVMNKNLSNTYNECISAIGNAMELKAFDYWDGNTGEVWKPVDYQCVSWNNSKV